MRRYLLPAALVTTVAVTILVETGLNVQAADGAAPVSQAYAPTVRGQVAAARLAGVEPDGDPLYQVAIQMRLATSAGVPAAHLIVSSYLENFKPDTTPILPDLLHPSRPAQNLGSFLQGKALLTDDAGDVLYIGSFVADGFLDNTNHAAMTLIGSGAAYGAVGKLRGAFTLYRDATLSGWFRGTFTLPPAARAQLRKRQGARMKPLKQILRTVTVKPSYMVGRATTGTHGTPLPNRYIPTPGTPQGGAAVQPARSGGPSGHINPWSIVAAIGAIISLLIAGVLYALERRRTVH